MSTGKVDVTVLLPKSWVVDHIGDDFGYRIDGEQAVYEAIGGDNLCFGTPEPVDTEQKFKRMVFSDIKNAGFDWRWESSPDGRIWTRNWSIKYSRRA